VTLDSSFSGRQTLMSATRAEVFRTPHREVLMLYGADIGYMVWRSAPVTEEMLHDCTLTVGDADPFYIAKDTAFAVGSDAHPVTALCQQEDQMLVFNDESIWAIRYPEAESDDTEIFPIRAGLGCSSRGGVVLCGKYPVALTPAGIARLKFPTSNPDYCEVELLSSAIHERLGGDFLQNAVLFWDEFRQELWVRNPNDSDGTVWICDPERDIWFRFDGIAAKWFFLLNGNIGFADMTSIYYFQEDVMLDNGTAFSAEYRSHYFDFARLSAPSRSLRLSAVTENNGDSLSTCIQTDRGAKTLQLGTASAEATPISFDRRMEMGRFRLLQFLITAKGQSRCRIYSYSIAANP
jgi:hypothetical protein